MKAHKIDMIAAWARENGLKGYEHLDPQVREKNRQKAIKTTNERRRREEEDKEKRRYQALFLCTFQYKQCRIE